MDPTSRDALSPSRALVALGASLVLRGPGARGARFVASLTAAGFVLASLVASRSGHADGEILVRASSTFAWGAGLLLAHAASARAFAADRASGVLLRVRTSGFPAASYVFARALGLVLVLGIVLLSAQALVVVASAVSMFAVPKAVWLRSTVATFVYLALFSVTMGLVSMAALARLSRSRGYMILAAVLLAPLPLVRLSSSPIPRPWRSVCSIPDALDGIRSAIVSGGLPEACRAAVVLALVIAASALVLQSAAKHVAKQGAV